MGHSFGGKAAFQLAQEFPDKVRCVIALAPSVNMLYSYWKGLTGERGLPDAQTINARLGQHKQELGVLLAQAKQDRTMAGASRAKQLSGELRYLDVMKDMVGFNETAVEQRLRTPTLVLHGIDDEAVSIHYVRRLREANPAVTLKEYENAGHGFAIEGRLGVDQRATSRLTADMAREISGFIREKAGQGTN
jgi:pimeloyl-ACP methyl ester carboxylesterase